MAPAVLAELLKRLWSTTGSLTGLPCQQIADPPHIIQPTGHLLAGKALSLQKSVCVVADMQVAFAWCEESAVVVSFAMKGGWVQAYADHAMYLLISSTNGVLTLASAGV